MTAKSLTTALVASALALAFAGQAFAHGDAPHPKCKKG
jgi:Spy/CpxP family protein refolding chaperone